MLTDILKYFEELKRYSNTEIVTKDIFEMAYSIDISTYIA
jgi:hypothetical protein